MKKFGRRAAFTLIELLVVITIIAILAALLFPVVARMRQEAFKTKALSQLKQIYTASALYSNDWDQYVVPSTNYDAPVYGEARIWPPLLKRYANSEAVFIAPLSEAAFAKGWDTRGEMSIGLNAGTAYDSNGCFVTQDDYDGCQGWVTAATFDSHSEPARTALFSTTANGPTDQGYRGYEFNPYNGLIFEEDERLTPPIVGDRDMVAELFVIPGEYKKPIYARYLTDGKDSGQAPIVFADGHAKSYSAKSIRDRTSKIIWRFR